MRAPGSLSLRWKAFAVLLTVLAAVHAALGYNGYLNMHAQFDERVTADFVKFQVTLQQMFDTARRDAEEQARALVAVASIEELPWVGELFFKFSGVRYYDPTGRRLSEWWSPDARRHAEGLAREQVAVPKVSRSAAARLYVECPDECLLRALVPAFERGGRQIVAAVTVPLGPTLAEFRRLSGADVALLATAVPGAPTLWGRRVAAVSDPERLPALLATVTTPAAPGVQPMALDARDHALLAALVPAPVQTAEPVDALLLIDQTDRLASIATQVDNYTILAVLGLAIATSAIFILLTPSLRRLGLITQGLPLLAVQEFDEARRLFERAARHGGGQDEIDRLHDTAQTLADQLQKLMGVEAASAAQAQFLAAMSHEIRTPINGLLGLLELHEGTELDAAQREAVRIMRDSAATLLAVVDDILDFSKSEAGQLSVDPVPMSLRAMVEGALETLAASAASKGLRLVCYVPPTLPEKVRADPVRLRQVLLNLCSNAIKFTEHGHVSVALELLAGGIESVRLRCTVKDTGIGIAPEAHGRLFRPFSQAEASTSRRYGGTGLGLSISHSLVQRMGGHMGFSSKPGAGSTFWFELECPVVDGPPPPLTTLKGVGVHLALADVREREHLWDYLTSAGAHVAGDTDWRLRVDDEAHTGVRLSVRDGTDTRALGRPIRYMLLIREAADLCGLAPPPIVEGAPAIAPAPRRLAGRVLVAEDHPTNRRVIREQLTRLGYDADIVENGRQALEQLERGTYLLLITDLHMPDVDGMALTEEIRRREQASSRPPLPIVGLTADVLPAAVARCRAAGMSDVLRKPIAIAELGRALERWTRHAPEASAPAVDRAALARLMGTDDPSALREVLQEFLRVNDAHVRELQDAVRDNDAARSRALAHRLSGSARTIGASALAAAALALEQAAQKGRVAELGGLFGKIRADFERVSREIDASARR